MKHQTLKNLVLSFVALTIVLPPLSAQTDRVDSPTRSYAPAKVLKAPQRIIYTDGDLPDEYSRLGTTSLWVRNDSAVFDILGKFNSSYYSSTYDGGGYITAIRVDDEDDGIWASDIKSWYTDRMEDCIRMGDNENYQWYRNEFLTGRAHGLDVKVTLEPLGEYAHVVYNVTNTDETPHTFSLGSRADLSLGDYDLAPITLVRDKNGNPFGLEMASSLNPEEAATLQFLFKNRSGVSDVDGYWFGQYGQNSSSRAVAGDYTCPRWHPSDFTQAIIAPESEDISERWRYTFTEPAAGWTAPDFNDSGWSEGVAGFGTSGRSHVRTPWEGDNRKIWLRRTFDLDITPEQARFLRLKIFHNAEGANQVYINGVLAFSNPEYYSEYYDYEISDAALAALNLHGTNTIAAYSYNSWGGQTLDIALGLQEGLWHGAIEGEDEYTTFIKTDEQGGDTWRYTMEKPADDWNAASFDDSSWKVGRSPFAPYHSTGTDWRSDFLWMRKEVTLNVSRDDLKDLRMRIVHDGGCDLYFNGVLAYTGEPWMDWLEFRDINEQAVNALNPKGKNIIAMYVWQDYGGQQADLGLGLYHDKSIVEINNLYIENGSYDSGMGWCWRDRLIAPGETQQLSVLVCIGNVPDSQYDPNTGPDVSISEFSITPTEVQAKDSVQAVIVIANKGNQPMPSGLDVTVSGPWKGGSWEYRTRQEIPVGQSLRLTPTIAVTDYVTEVTAQAWVNSSRAFKETNYDNNTASASYLIKVVPPYTATLATDKTLYDVGDVVRFTGQIAGAKNAFSQLKLVVRNAEGGDQTFNVVTDENGAFSYPWTTYEGWTGHFLAAAVYPESWPDDAAFTACTFDVRGFQTEGPRWDADDAWSAWRIFVVDSTYVADIAVRNPGVIPLTDVTFTQVSKNANLDVKLTGVSTFEADGKAVLHLAVTPKAATRGDQYEELRLRITTAEGPARELTVWYYNVNPTALLTANVSEITTTMLMGGWTDYAFTITNEGAAATGEIALVLPEVAWMSPLTPLLMASLQPGEKATVMLRFMPDESMKLNVPLTGRLALNVENGQGLSLPYSVEPVSDAQGRLVVDVCDENTYYTAEAPHVSGAEVRVTHPVSGAVVAEGTTGQDGLAAFDLPAGWYTVTVKADRHDGYQNNISIDPSRTTELTVNLSFQAITIDFEVVEVNETDEYKIVTTMTFETYVPQPVVEMIVDEQPFEAMELGQSLVYNTVLINRGLIRAQALELTFPDNEFFSFTPLCEVPDSLEAQTSAVIPVRVTRLFPGENSEASMRHRRTGTYPHKAGPVQAGSNMPCHMDQNVKYEWPCGKDTKSGGYSKVLYQQSCSADSYGSFGGYWSGGGGGGYGAWSGGGTIASRSYTGCNDCLNEFGEKALLCGLGYIPVVGTVTGLITASDVVDYALVIGSLFTGPFGGAVLNTVGCVKSFATMDCLTGGDDDDDDDDAPDRRASAMPSFVKAFQQKALLLCDEMEAGDALIKEIIGNPDVWNDVDSEQILAILRAFPADHRQTTADALRHLKPQTVSDEAFDALIERLFGTNPDNCPDEAIIAARRAVIDDCEARSRQMGYASTSEMWTFEQAKLEKQLDQASSAVCATVKIQLSQTMTFTRQAFEGTLTVYNGSADEAMRDVRLSLTVTASDGTMATAHEMEVHMQSLDGFGGQLAFDAGWTLDALQTGVAKVKFIPTRYAAPDEPVVYTIGGSLTYIDPFSGYEVTRELLPVTITVRPTPVLEMIYFVQRDIMSDDPFTDEVEPAEDAEFSLILLNKGAGTARDLRIVTDQPRIVENEKGLLINYEMVSSQLNGGDKVLALGQSVATEFGDVPPHSSAYAQWWMRSSIYGHFIDYDIEATHVTSYDNPDLTLLDTIHVHELIHSIAVRDADGTEQAAFLVNDVADADDAPDAIYFVDGTTTPVTTVSGLQAERSDAGTDVAYYIALPATGTDWVYGWMPDPTDGHGRVRSIIRLSDGADIPLRCCWLTQYVFNDARKPVAENRLHLAGCTGAEGDTYRIVFQPMPAVWLAVDDIFTVPDAGSWLSTPLSTLCVRFNKPIMEATFTTDDLRLSHEGTRLDVSSVGIVPVGTQSDEYELRLGHLTEQTGYYLLTVQTADIIDHEGYNGERGRSVSWMQLLGEGIDLPSLKSLQEDSLVYDLQGRRVMNPVRGIYIQSGRKVVIK
ncbi:MAG: carboxypeptidase regulatory-like domain-containing protein [Bacteroidaceae bacterium]|nr:carboxypeptidase regulatory-like domain-containing protein [Bacteroidaceae bacterium]